MSCPEYQQLATLVEGKRQGYTYIRLQESKVALSKTRYDELVKEAFDALTQAIKDSLLHQRTCAQCRKEAGAGEPN
jgi:hypothetical protein